MKIKLIIFCFILALNVSAQRIYIAQNFGFTNIKGDPKNEQLFVNKYYILTIDGKITYSPFYYGLAYRQNIYKSFFIESTGNKFVNTIKFNTLELKDTILNVSQKGFFAQTGIGYYFFNRKMFKIYGTAGMNLAYFQKYKTIKEITYGTGKYETDPMSDDSTEIKETKKSDMENLFTNILYQNIKYEDSFFCEIGVAMETKIFWTFSIRYSQQGIDKIKTPKLINYCIFNIRTGFYFKYL